MLLFFVDQVNCSAGAVNKEGQTLAAKATEALRCTSDFET